MQFSISHTGLYIFDLNSLCTFGDILHFIVFLKTNKKMITKKKKKKKKKKKEKKERKKENNNNNNNKQTRNV